MLSPSLATVCENFTTCSYQPKQKRRCHKIDEISEDAQQRASKRWSLYLLCWTKKTKIVRVWSVSKARNFYPPNLEWKSSSNSPISPHFSFFPPHISFHSSSVIYPSFSSLSFPSPPFPFSPSLRVSFSHSSFQRPHTLSLTRGSVGAL